MFNRLYYGLWFASCGSETERYGTNFVCSSGSSEINGLTSPSTEKLV